MLRLQRDRHRISLGNFLNDSEMDCRITDYALLADLFPAAFELRFDQTDDLSSLVRRFLTGKQDLGQRNKGNINGEICGAS